LISDLISALWPAPSRALRILNSVQLPDLSRLQRPEALGRDAGGPERLGKRERRRVDRFMDTSLPAALRQREQWAVRLLDIDDRVSAHVKALQEMGMKSPYLRAVVVARCNPVRWIPSKKGEKPPMTMAELLTRMTANLRKFDPSKVRPQDLAIVAAVGEGMRGTPGVAARVFGALGRAKVNVMAIAQGSSELNISLVVMEKDREKAVRLIHEEFHR